MAGCLGPIPADNLPILAGIQPAELRCNGETLSLARRAMEPGHLLHSALTRPSSANARRLKSIHPFLPAAQQLISSSDNNTIRAAQGGSPMECGVGGQPHKTPYFHPRHRPHTTGATLPRRAWVRLKRLRIGVGRFRSCVYKWGMASSEACEFGAEEQTVDHVVLQCPIHGPPHAWPDGSGRWGNWMAAQHLPRDLARPSSG